MKRVEMVTFHLGMGVGVALAVGALVIDRRLIFAVILFVIIPPIVHMWRHGFRPREIEHVMEDKEPWRR